MTVDDEQPGALSASVITTLADPLVLFTQPKRVGKGYHEVVNPSVESIPGMGDFFKNARMFREEYFYNLNNDVFSLMALYPIIQEHRRKYNALSKCSIVMEMISDQIKAVGGIITMEKARSLREDIKENLTEQIEIFDNSIRKLKDEIQSLNAEELRSKVLMLRTSLSLKVQEKNAIEQELAVLTRENTTSMEQVAELTSENVDLVRDRESAIKEAGTLKLKLEAEIVALQTTIAQKDKNIQDILAAEAKKQAEIESLITDKTKLEAQVRELTSRLTMATNDIGEAYKKANLWEDISNRHKQSAATIEDSLTASHLAQVSEMQKAYTAMESAYKQRVDELYADVDTAEEKLRSASSELTTVTASLAQTKLSLDDKLSKYAELKATSASLGIDLDNVRKSHDSVQSKFDTLKSIRDNKILVLNSRYMLTSDMLDGKSLGKALAYWGNVDPLPSFKLHAMDKKVGLGSSNISIEWTRLMDEASTIAAMTNELYLIANTFDVGVKTSSLDAVEYPPKFAGGYRGIRSDGDVEDMRDSNGFGFVIMTTVSSRDDEVEDTVIVSVPDLLKDIKEFVGTEVGYLYSESKKQGVAISRSEDIDMFNARLRSENLNLKADIRKVEELKGVFTAEAPVAQKALMRMVDRNNEDMKGLKVQIGNVRGSLAQAQLHAKKMSDDVSTMSMHVSVSRARTQSVIAALTADYKSQRRSMMEDILKTIKGLFASNMSTWNEFKNTMPAQVNPEDTVDSFLSWSVGKINSLNETLQSVKSRDSAYMEDLKISLDTMQATSTRQMALKSKIAAISAKMVDVHGRVSRLLASKAPVEFKNNSALLSKYKAELSSTIDRAKSLEDELYNSQMQCVATIDSLEAKARASTSNDLSSIYDIHRVRGLVQSIPFNVREGIKGDKADTVKVLQLTEKLRGKAWDIFSGYSKRLYSKMFDALQVIDADNTKWDLSEFIDTLSSLELKEYVAPIKKPVEFVRQAKVDVVTPRADVDQDTDDYFGTDQQGLESLPPSADVDQDTDDYFGTDQQGLESLPPSADVDQNTDDYFGTDQQELESLPPSADIAQDTAQSNNLIALPPVPVFEELSPPAPYYTEQGISEQERLEQKRSKQETLDAEKREQELIENKKREALYAKLRDISANKAQRDKQRRGGSESVTNSLNKESQDDALESTKLSDAIALYVERLAALGLSSKLSNMRIAIMMPRILIKKIALAQADGRTVGKLSRLVLTEEANAAILDYESLNIVKVLVDKYFGTWSEYESLITMVEYMLANDEYIKDLEYSFEQSSDPVAWQSSTTGQYFAPLDMFILQFIVLLDKLIDAYRTVISHKDTIEALNVTNTKLVLTVQALENELYSDNVVSNVEKGLVARISNFAKRIVRESHNPASDGRLNMNYFETRDLDGKIREAILAYSKYVASNKETAKDLISQLQSSQDGSSVADLDDEVFAVSDDEEDAESDEDAEDTIIIPELNEDPPLTVPKEVTKMKVYSRLMKQIRQYESDISGYEEQHRSYDEHIERLESQFNFYEDTLRKYKEQYGELQVEASDGKPVTTLDVERLNRSAGAKRKLAKYLLREFHKGDESNQSLKDRADMLEVEASLIDEQSKLVAPTAIAPPSPLSTNTSGKPVANAVADDSSKAPLQKAMLEACNRKLVELKEKLGNMMKNPMPASAACSADTLMAKILAMDVNLMASQIIANDVDYAVKLASAIQSNSKLSDMSDSALFSENSRVSDLVKTSQDNMAAIALMSNNMVQHRQSMTTTTEQLKNMASASEKIKSETLQVFKALLSRDTGRLSSLVETVKRLNRAIVDNIGDVNKSGLPNIDYPASVVPSRKWKEVIDAELRALEEGSSAGTETARLSEMVDDLSRDLTDKTARLRELEEGSSAADTETARLREMVDNLSRDLMDKTAKLRALEEGSSDAATKTERLREMIDELSRDLQGKVDKLREMQSTNGSLMSIIDDLDDAMYEISKSAELGEYDRNLAARGFKHTDAINKLQGVQSIYFDKHQRLITFILQSLAVMMNIRQPSKETRKSYDRILEAIPAVKMEMVTKMTMLEEALARATAASTAPDTSTSDADTVMELRRRAALADEMEEKLGRLTKAESDLDIANSRINALELEKATLSQQIESMTTAMSRDKEISDAQGRQSLEAIADARGKIIAEYSAVISRLKAIEGNVAASDSSIAQDIQIMQRLVQQMTRAGPVVTATTAKQEVARVETITTAMLQSIKKVTSHIRDVSNVDAIFTSVDTITAHVLKLHSTLADVLKYTERAVSQHGDARASHTRLKQAMTQHATELAALTSKYSAEMHQARESSTAMADMRRAKLAMGVQDALAIITPLVSGIRSGITNTAGLVARGKAALVNLDESLQSSQSVDCVNKIAELEALLAASTAAGCAPDTMKNLREGMEKLLTILKTVDIPAINTLSTSIGNARDSFNELHAVEVASTGKARVEKLSSLVISKFLRDRLSRISQGIQRATASVGAMKKSYEEETLVSLNKLRSTTLAILDLVSQSAGIAQSTVDQVQHTVDAVSALVPVLLDNFDETMSTFDRVKDEILETKIKVSTKIITMLNKIAGSLELAMVELNFINGQRDSVVKIKNRLRVNVFKEREALYTQRVEMAQNYAALQRLAIIQSEELRDLQARSMESLRICKRAAMALGKAIGTDMPRLRGWVAAARALSIRAVTQSVQSMQAQQASDVETLKVVKDFEVLMFTINGITGKLPELVDSMVTTSVNMHDSIASGRRSLGDLALHANAMDSLNQFIVNGVKRATLNVPKATVEKLRTGLALLKNNQDGYINALRDEIFRLSKNLDDERARSDNAGANASEAMLDTLTKQFTNKAITDGTLQIELASIKRALATKSAIHSSKISAMSKIISSAKAKIKELQRSAVAPGARNMLANCAKTIQHMPIWVYDDQPAPQPQTVVIKIVDHNTQKKRTRTAKVQPSVDDKWDSYVRTLAKKKV
jgi:chromosome segregation ATPase